jgi:hypothetical protein
VPWPSICTDSFFGMGSSLAFCSPLGTAFCALVLRWFGQPQNAQSSRWPCPEPSSPHRCSCARWGRQLGLRS